MDKITSVVIDNVNLGFYVDKKHAEAIAYNIRHLAKAVSEGGDRRLQDIGYGSGTAINVARWLLEAFDQADSRLS